MDDGQRVLYEIGPLRLWIQRTSHEWQIATEGLTGVEDRLAVSRPEWAPVDVVWRRWAFRDESDGAQLEPVMPDRALVVRPESSLVIPPGEEVLFFVSIPLWVRAKVAAASGFITLLEVPTVVLSNTWFGETTDGDLCYALKTGASRSLAGIKRGGYRVVCPLMLRNHSEDQLNFQKICLRTQYVKIYAGATRYWTDSVTITYEGRQQLSTINYGTQAPDHEPISGEIGPAREVVRKNLVQRSFGNLRSMAFFQ